jgi:hypothetical protein
MKEFLFQIKKRTTAVISKMMRRFMRFLFVKDVITPQNCFDVPIIINNRNRVTFLKQMLERIESFGYKNIYILDNDSTYPPLLEFYKTTNAKVIYLKKNVGYMALWKTEVFGLFKNKHYVYSDPDILLQKDCPKDFVYQLYKELHKYPTKEKAGVALRIDDLPDNRQKKDVVKWEEVYWKNVLSENVYDALVDTTLALYKPLAYGNAEECAAIRVGGKLTAQHLPWYQDADNLSEEDVYYKNHANSSSSWANKY